LLLAKDNAGKTVFHVAAESSNEVLFQGMLNSAKENLTKEEVNELLLAKDNAGKTVLHIAAKSSNVELFQGILNSAKRI
jgi:ankyrin repeat protein